MLSYINALANVIVSLFPLTITNQIYENMTSTEMQLQSAEMIQISYWLFTLNITGIIFTIIIR